MIYIIFYCNTEKRFLVHETILILDLEGALFLVKRTKLQMFYLEWSGTFSFRERNKQFLNNFEGWNLKNLSYLNVWACVKLLQEKTGVARMFLRSFHCFQVLSIGISLFFNKSTIRNNISIQLRLYCSLLISIALFARSSVLWTGDVYILSYSSTIKLPQLYRHKKKHIFLRAKLPKLNKRIW